MIVFKNLNELKKGPKPIYEDILECISPTDYKDPFLTSIGGDVHLVENLEDLSQISINGTSLNDAVVQGFDAVEYVGTEDEFIMCLIINNNAGGPSYFIPRAVYSVQPNVELSLELFES